MEFISVKRASKITITDGDRTIVIFNGKDIQIPIHTIANIESRNCKEESGMFPDVLPSVDLELPFPRKTKRSVDNGILRSNLDDELNEIQYNMQRNRSMCKVYCERCVIARFCLLKLLVPDDIVRCIISKCILLIK